jgi:hypothetical protein
VPSVIRNPKDFWSGVLFVVIGLAAVIIARDYPMGSVVKMGPAYFPTALGWVLTGIGAVAILRSFIRIGEPIQGFAVKQLALIVIPTAVFGMLIRPGGLIVATLVLVLVSAYASSKFRFGPALALAIGMAAFSALVFVKALGVPIPLLGSWFGV